MDKITLFDKSNIGNMGVNMARALRLVWWGVEWGSVESWRGGFQGSRRGAGLGARNTVAAPPHTPEHAHGRASLVVSHECCVVRVVVALVVNLCSNKAWGTRAGAYIHTARCKQHTAICPLGFEQAQAAYNRTA